MIYWKVWGSKMGDFTGMEELLQDFLLEASDLLSDVDSKLMDLEKSPQNKELLNMIFRGFHTIKGGAGFLNASELVTLCHLTENLFDKLRNAELQLNPVLMDVIMAATGEVRLMFNDLGNNTQPKAAPAEILSSLEDALEGREIKAARTAASKKEQSLPVVAPTSKSANKNGPDWNALYDAVVKSTSTKVAKHGSDELKPAETAAEIDEEQLKKSAFGRRAEDIPGGTAAPAATRREGDVPAKDNTIRVDTDRLDQVLNLSGEIGLTKNRLTHLRTDI